MTTSPSSPPSPALCSSPLCPGPSPLATILAVDDASESLSLLVSILAPQGYLVRPADSGTLALATAIANPPDLILMDINMPGMNGLEVCQRLKADEKTRNIPIILISGFADVKEWVKGLQLGAADYISKPFQIDELLTRVKTHLALGKARDSLVQQTEALRQTNEQLQAALDERQRVEEELRQSLDLADHSRRDLLSALEDLQRQGKEKVSLEAQFQQAQKMESVGRLAGGVAHDFNNMLGVIIGYTELAMDQVDPTQPLHAELQQIFMAAQRSADLTRQLLAFARKQTIVPKVLDLNETVAGMLKMVQRLIGEDIQLLWLPKANLWSVKMDPSQIDQILANLCVNARDAISGVGKIIIETENSTIDKDYCAAHAGFVPGEYVLLAVSDNGCGIDKEILDHIFEPFFTTKVIGTGTGLGLATVYGVVKQNNGYIIVYSEPGHGTTFRIFLPRHGDMAEQANEDATEPIIGGQETILLVEDEAVVLEMATKMLETLGYTVLAANTTEKAIHLARENEGRIHLLMTDVIMPAMNGRDLARNLQSLYPDLKCLFISGYTADVIAHHGVLDNGVDFIAKPFSKKDLAAKIREVLD